MNLFEGMWEAVGGSPPYSATHLTGEEARQLIAQVERDLKADVKRLRDETARRPSCSHCPLRPIGWSGPHRDLAAEYTTRN